MTIEIPQLFLACCHDGPARYAIQAPFQAGEYIAATNGAILCRIKKSDAPWAANLPVVRGITPPVNDCGWSETFGAPVPLFEPPAERIQQCKECGGIGVHDLGHECEACGGDAHWPSNRRIVLDNERNIGIGEKYARLLWNAGVRELAPVEPWDVNAKKPLRWSLGAIEGMLMPMSPRDPEDEVRR